MLWSHPHIGTRLPGWRAVADTTQSVEPGNAFAQMVEHRVS
jgi:hypothetical protein